MRQGGFILHVDRVRSKKKNRKKQKQQKIHPAQNTPRYPQQPGDRDHLETARDETHSTPASIDPGFVEIGLVQLSQLLMAKSPLGRFVPSVSSFTANGSEKREKEKKTSPPPAIVTATPTGHPTPSKLRGRVGKSLRPARS